jgi:hypothetical protein
MRPRYEEQSEDLAQLLKGAKDLEQRLAKSKSSQPEYSAKEGSEQGYEFMTQSAGKDNVRNQGFSTNNHLIESEDVANKGAISEVSKVLDKPTQYPDAMDDTGYRINEEGGKGPVMKSLGGDVERMAVQDLKKSVDQLARRLN